jgi:hypothetical protein
MSRRLRVEAIHTLTLTLAESSPPTQAGPPSVAVQRSVVAAVI